MTEAEIKATIIKAMDDEVSDAEAKVAFAGVLAHVAHNVERIATALERLTGGVIELPIGFKVDKG